MKIKNRVGEDIDMVIEGNINSSKTIVFAHGFGTNKNENGNLFPDLAKPFLDEYRVIRFDFTGYGQSGGRQEDASIDKHAEDLRSVLDYARSKSSIGLLAFSMGCFVVLKLQPDGINKTVFISPPNSNPGESIAAMKKRIQSRPGGLVDENGVSIYPRSDGSVQKLGPTYWTALMNFDPVKAMAEYSTKTNLTVFKPKQDEIVKQESPSPYQRISTLRYVQLDGNHGFSDQVDRANLIAELQKVLKPNRVRT